MTTEQSRHQQISDDPKQIADMFERLRYGFPLSVDEQRWLWNRAAQPTRPHADVTFLGPLPPPRHRCKECNGVGTRALQCSIAEYRELCGACRGRGYHDEPAPALDLSVNPLPH